MKLFGEAGLRKLLYQIKNALNNKVDKVNGKGLSSNDYTATAKSKVDAIPSNPKYTDTVLQVSVQNNKLYIGVNN